jgi:hypothetical protein
LLCSKSSESPYLSTFRQHCHRACVVVDIQPSQSTESVYLSRSTSPPDDLLSNSTDEALREGAQHLCETPLESTLLHQARCGCSPTALRWRSAMDLLVYATAASQDGRSLWHAVRCAPLQICRPSPDDGPLSFLLAFETL